MLAKLNRFIDKNGTGIGLFAALAIMVYAFVPPPHRASAQFVDQLTFAGTSTGSVTGSTTAYAITIPNLSANPVGVVLRFIPNITSVGPTQINVSGIGLVNVLRHSSIGNVAFSGGEFQAGELTCIVFNGTAYELACNVDLTPIGRTVEFRGSTAPRGTLIEDGSCVSTTTYAALNNVIGNTYGSCSTGLFKLPFSNGTTFVAYDNQGANGAANRITTASCATPNSPVECGSQLATLTAALVPNITSLNASQAIVVDPGGNSGLSVPAAGSGGFALEPAPTTSGNFVVSAPGGVGSLVNENTFSAPNSISVVSSGTGGTSPTHPVQNPMLPGIRAIKF